ncbi:hypothetical protein CIPAW_16G087500 [Carya illinoinensis]|uniref:Uncharacterized protein n=1 Tax=Carya illinoinensis TaxID=32201 RepID=A0A8T1N5I8_CARIL|nr:hypothetical protein CIPAW_16G087500 [Carya illinoinensis]
MNGHGSTYITLKRCTSLAKSKIIIITLLKFMYHGIWGQYPDTKSIQHFLPYWLHGLQILVGDAKPEDKTRSAAKARGKTNKSAVQTRTSCSCINIEYGQALISAWYEMWQF